MKTPLYVISDLHLMDAQKSFLFNEAKENAFVKLNEIIMESEGVLLLAGDIFDFTGMTPNGLGQREFFTECVPHDLLARPENREIMAKAMRFRSTTDLLLATQLVFPRFFRSLKQLAEQNKLLYIPGNHDCDFLNKNSRADFARALDVAEDAVLWLPQFVDRNLVIAAHGNEFDPPNNTDHGCQNPGFVFTSALYEAVIPALKMLGIPQTIIEAIPAVRPEEQTIIGLESYLSNEQISRLLAAFIRLLQRNGFFRGLARLPTWFVSHEVPLLTHIFLSALTPERLAKFLPKEESLILSARAGASALRKKIHRLHPEIDAENSLVVLGHTHELDYGPNYVNLGTWIDHITGLGPEDIARAEVNLPVLRVQPHGSAELYDISTFKDVNARASLEAARLLWQRPVAVS